MMASFSIVCVCVLQYRCRRNHRLKFCAAVIRYCCVAHVVAPAPDSLTLTTAIATVLYRQQAAAVVRPVVRHMRIQGCVYRTIGHTSSSLMKVCICASAIPADADMLICYEHCYSYCYQSGQHQLLINYRICIRTYAILIIPSQRTFCLRILRTFKNDGNLNLPVKLQLIR